MKRRNHIRLLAVLLVEFFLSTLLFSLCFQATSHSKSTGHFITHKTSVPTSSDSQILYEEREGEYRTEDGNNDETANSAYLHFEDIVLTSHPLELQLILPTPNSLHIHFFRNLSISIPIYLAHQTLLI